MQAVRLRDADLCLDPSVHRPEGVENRYGKDEDCRKDPHSSGSWGIGCAEQGEDREAEAEE